MPIAYRIDPERRVILTHAWGVLTDAELLAHKERLLHDAAFDPHMPELSDVREIERLDVTAAGVRAMVAHDAAHSTRGSGHRMALVVPTDEAFGMARMYELMGPGENGSVGVFRTLAEGEAWLAAGDAG
jgi:hypothetical protein